MGMFDYYNDKTTLVQLKVGELVLHTYRVGDKADIPDGLYLSPLEGYVAIHDGKVAAIGESVWDKWGGEVCLDALLGDRNPVVIAVKELTNASGEVQP